MTFRSILFLNGTDRRADRSAHEPSFFGDLNLDQIVSAVTTHKQEYDLRPFFHTPLHDTDAVDFRHEVMQDLEVPDLMRIIKAFAFRMCTVREHLSQSEKRRNRHQKMRWFLDAVALYSKTVTTLARNISTAEVKSRGLLQFREYVTGHISSQRFNALIEEAGRLLVELTAIRYSILIRGLCVEVRPYQGERDYGAEVASVFERFKRDAVRTYSFEFGDNPDVNMIEGNILRLVAQTHSEIFDRFERYCESSKDFLDPVIVGFDREVQFFIAYLDYIAPFKKAGLRFCYPRASRNDKDIHASENIRPCSRRQADW